MGEAASVMRVLLQVFERSDQCFSCLAKAREARKTHSLMKIARAGTRSSWLVVPVNAD